MTSAERRALLMGLTSRFGLPTLGGTVAIILAVVYFAAGSETASVAVRDDVDVRVVDLLAGYLILLIVLERAIGGMVSLFFRRSLVDWQLRLSRIAEVLEKERVSEGVLRQVCMREYERVDELQEANFAKGIERVKSEGGRDEYRAYLILIKHCYEFLQARVQSKVSTIVAWIVATAGFVLAISGMRILGELTDYAGDGNSPSWVLTVADVLLTGAFLGGGSAAISNLLAQFQRMLERDR